MSPERWQRIQSVVEAVLDALPEDRETTLTRECGGDRELRAAAEEILSHYSESDDLMGHAPFQPLLKVERDGLEAGTRLGPYQVERELGRGSMGRVYLAERADGTFSKTVAVKVIRYAGAHMEEMFRAERRMLAGLDHGNIARIYDGGSTADGNLYLVMEYVDGEPLDLYCNQGGLGLEQRLRLFALVAGAVDYAHRKGVLHLDLKPSNVLVDGDGHPKLLDFGIAGLAGEAARGFTPRYASPEAQRGAPASARDDVYALGVMLEDLLQGEKTPADLATIVRKARAQEGQQRYEGARALGDDIENFLACRPVHAYAGSFFYRTEKLVRRQPWLVVTALLAVAAGGAYWMTRPEILPAAAKVDRLTTLPGREAWPSISPDGRTVAFASRAAGNWDIYLQSKREEAPKNLTADSPADDTQPAFSPDGKQIAFRSTRDGGGIFLLQLDTGAVRKVSASGFHPSWSPDGQQIALSTDQFAGVSPGPRQSHIVVVPARGGPEREITSNELVPDAMQGVWSPDGKWIAFWGYDSQRISTIYVTAASGQGKPVVVTKGGPSRADGGRVWSPFWSASGRYLYFNSDRGGTATLWRIGVDRGNGVARGEAVRLPLPLLEATSFSLSRNGRHLTYTVDSESANIQKLGFDPKALAVVGTPQAVTVGENGFLRPRVSPDGKNVVFESTAYEDIWTCRSDGSGLRALIAREAAQFPRFVDNETVGFASKQNGQHRAVTVKLDGSGRQAWTASENSTITLKWITPRRLVVGKTGERYYFQELGKPPEPMDNPLPADFWMSFSLSARGETQLLGRVIPLRLRRAARSMIFDLSTRKMTDLGVLTDDAIELFEGGRYLLYKDFQHVLRVLDRKTGENRELLRLSKESVTGVDLTADQKWLFYSEVKSAGDVWLAEMSSAL